MAVVNFTIPPKEVSNTHEGQKFICRYDPQAPVDKRWVWRVKYVQTYEFVGNAPSLSGAVKCARRKIHELNNSGLDDD